MVYSMSCAYFVKYPIEFYIIAGFVGMVMGGLKHYQDQHILN